MPEFEGFRWKETFAVVGAVATLVGFLTLVWIEDTRDLDKRIRAIEIKQVKLWCAVNPETCMGNRNAP